MRIKKVEIRDYKAFYGKNEFNVEGKNLLIYGENGSGKSSFYYALKDFFQSSTETLSYDETENIFLTKAQKGKGFIKVTFNPDRSGAANDKTYTVKKTSKDTYTAAVLHKKRVQRLIGHSTSHQLMWYIDSLVLRNPLLRKAASC